MPLIDKSEITPFRVVLGVAIVAALVLGSTWVGGGFDPAPPRDVEVRLGGPPGTFYRIQGGPEGDTGPVSIYTPYKFATDADVDELRLRVTVTPPADAVSDEPSMCRIFYDGHLVGSSRPSPGSAGRICETG